MVAESELAIDPSGYSWDARCTLRVVIYRTLNEITHAIKKHVGANEQNILLFTPRTVPHVECRRDSLGRPEKRNQCTPIQPHYLHNEAKVYNITNRSARGVTPFWPACGSQSSRAFYGTWGPEGLGQTNPLSTRSRMGSASPPEKLQL